MKRQTRRKSIRELMKHFERVHYKIFFVTLCIASLGLLMIEADRETYEIVRAIASAEED